jgi:hypothetical protein
VETDPRLSGFSSFWPLILHQCITFSFFWNYHLKLYKSSCNSKIIFKDFLGGSKIGYGLNHWDFKKKKQPPLLWGFVTFWPLVHFCQFLVQQMHQEEGSSYFLDAINNQVLLQKWRANLTLSVWTMATLP